MTENRVFLVVRLQSYGISLSGYMPIDSEAHALKDNLILNLLKDPAPLGSDLLIKKILDALHRG